MIARCLMSRVYNNKESNGPRTVPWGTPKVTGHWLDVWPSQTTDWKRCVRNNSNQFIIESWKLSVSIGAMSASKVLRNQGGIWSGPQALLGFNEDSCFKTNSAIIKDPKPGVGSELISGIFSRSSLVNTRENWLFKIFDLRPPSLITLPSTYVVLHRTKNVLGCPWLPHQGGHDILLLCRLKILVHAFPSGKKLVAVM